MQLLLVIFQYKIIQYNKNVCSNQYRQLNFKIEILDSYKEREGSIRILQK